MARVAAAGASPLTAQTAPARATRGCLPTDLRNQDRLTCQVTAGLNEPLHAHKPHRRTVLLDPKRTRGVARPVRITTVTKKVSKRLHIGEVVPETVGAEESVAA